MDNPFESAKICLNLLPQGVCAVSLLEKRLEEKGNKNLEIEKHGEEGGINGRSK